MFEIMAIPGGKSQAVTLDAWVERFAGQGFEAVVTRESTGVAWIEVNALRLRGYAVMAGRDVEAINFELHAPDPAPARLAVETAAADLGWDLDDEQVEDEADDAG